jgi:hypothetical protein
MSASIAIDWLPYHVCLHCANLHDVMTQTAHDIMRSGTHQCYLTQTGMMTSHETAQPMGSCATLSFAARRVALAPSQLAPATANKETNKPYRSRRSTDWSIELPAGPQRRADLGRPLTRECCTVLGSAARQSTCSTNSSVGVTGHRRSFRSLRMSSRCGLLAPCRTRAEYNGDKYVRTQSALATTADLSMRCAPFISSCSLLLVSVFPRHCVITGCDHADSHPPCRHCGHVSHSAKHDTCP